MGLPSQAGCSPIWGLRHFFLGLGATLERFALSSIGVWFTQSTGIIITSILNALVALIILASGFKNYVRFQWVMFYTVAVAFLVMFGGLLFTPASIFIERLNAFAVASGGAAEFLCQRSGGGKSGWDRYKPTLQPACHNPCSTNRLDQPGSGQPIALSRMVRSKMLVRLTQAFIFVGSLIVTGLLLALLAVGLERLAGSEFLYVAGAGCWSAIPEATVNGFYLWPQLSLLRSHSARWLYSSSAWVIFLGSTQIVHNCYIGMTRIMVAMSLDRATRVVQQS